MGLFSALLGKGKAAPQAAAVKNEVQEITSKTIMEPFYMGESTDESLYMFYCKIFHLTPYIDQFYFMSKPEPTLTDTGYGIAALCNDGYLYILEYKGTVTKVCMNDVVNLGREGYNILCFDERKLEFPIRKYIMTTKDNVNYDLFLESDSGENSDSERFQRCAIRLHEQSEKPMPTDDLEELYNEIGRQNDELFALGGIDGEALYPMEKVCQAYDQRG